MRVPYGAAKGGVNAMTVNLAYEYAEHNIRVISPDIGGGFHVSQSDNVDAHFLDNEIRGSQEQHRRTKCTDAESRCRGCARGELNNTDH